MHHKSQELFYARSNQTKLNYKNNNKIQFTSPVLGTSSEKLVLWFFVLVTTFRLFKLYRCSEYL